MVVTPIESAQVIFYSSPLSHFSFFTFFHPHPFSFSSAVPSKSTMSHDATPDDAASCSASVTSSVDSSTHTSTASPPPSSHPPSPPITTPVTKPTHPTHPVSSTSAPPGLLNLGNTCYLNSVLQILYHVPTFRAGLLRYRPTHHTRAQPAPFACCLVRVLQEVFESLRQAEETVACEKRSRGVGRDGSGSGDRGEDGEDEEEVAREDVDYVAPRRLINLLRDERVCTEFDARGQQDAHEFMVFLLGKVSDCMQMEEREGEGMGGEEDGEEERDMVAQNYAQGSLRVFGGKKEGENVSCGVGGRVAKRRRCGREAVNGEANNEDVEKREENTEGRRECEGGGEVGVGTRKRRRGGGGNLVRGVFEGCAVTATRCYECEGESRRSERFMNVSVPVATGKCLGWALSSECAGEELRGGDKYFCGVCRTYTEARRWWGLEEVGEVFTVHLKLFAYGGRVHGGKVGVAIECPMKTGLGEWFVGKGKDKEGEEVEYRLTGVIVHEGSGAMSGHYYAYVRRESGWFCCDDLYVVSVGEEEMRGTLFTAMKSKRTAYLLFYSRV